MQGVAALALALWCPGSAVLGHKSRAAEAPPARKKLNVQWFLVDDQRPQLNEAYGQRGCARR